jgi:hypothetical protein
VRLKRKIVRQAAGGSGLLSVAGCNGINSTQSVSPLDFLIRGAGHYIDNQDTPPQLLPGTNITFAALQPLTFRAGTTQ